MEVTMISIIVGALGVVPKNWGKETVWILAGILRRVLEVSDPSEKSLADTGVKSSQGVW